MTTHATRRPLARLITIGVAGLLAAGLQLTGAAGAQAASAEWVDGGDDINCLNDDTGSALTNLADDKWCQPIPGCYKDPVDNKWVLPSRSTGIWQGDPNIVKYADELTDDEAPTPTKPAAPQATTGSNSGSKSSTTKKSSTKKSTTKKTTTKKSASASKSTSTSNTASKAAAQAEEVTGSADEVAATGAPSAPEAPVLTVDGNSLTVTWQPTADAELESVSGYVLRVSGQEPVETDATTTSYTFTDLPDGEYRAAVRAVNAAGESLSSAPSDVAQIGEIELLAGDLTWDGDVTPGAIVALEGTGYEPNTDIDIELHSTPTWLATVTTNAEGDFQTLVQIPEDIPEGDHTFVVAVDGEALTQTPVAVTAPVVEADATSVVAEADEAALATPIETVPPTTGLIILAALAIAGVLSLLLHAARRPGQKRRAARRADSQAEFAEPAAPASAFADEAPAGPAGPARPAHAAPAGPAHAAESAIPALSPDQVTFNRPVIPAFVTSSAREPAVTK